MKTNYTYTMNVERSNVSGMPYRLNGRNMNGGEMIEIVFKSVLGLAPVKDANTSFRDGDDIPEYGMSVKSKGFTLTDEFIGNTIDEIVTAYTENVHAQTFAYCMIDIDRKTLTAYTMNRKTFGQFLKTFGTLDKNSKTGKVKLRVKHETKRLVQWLETFCHVS